MQMMRQNDIKKPEKKQRFLYFGPSQNYNSVTNIFLYYTIYIDGHSGT